MRRRAHGPPLTLRKDRQAVQKRYRLLAEKFKKKMAKGRWESGINQTMTKLDVLAEELMEQEESEQDSEGRLVL